MHVHVCSGTAEHMGLGRPAAALLLPEKGPKQTGAEEGGCWHCRLGCRCLAWRGWGCRTAPRPQAVNTSGGHACAHPLVRSVRQAEADHVLQRAGRDPAPNKHRLHQLVSPPGPPGPLAGGDFIRLVASSQLNSKYFCPSGGRAG